MTDRATITLNLQQLRVVAKSLSRTLDAEARKMSRLTAGTHVHSQVTADYKLVDSVDAEVRNAMAELIQ